METLVTILGPTATGKTSLAAQLAKEINGEVISADSRQVYKELNIGAGKDLHEYVIKGKAIPYHLIDICEIGHEYNVFEYQEDFHRCLNEITERKKHAILCGGTGLYIQAVLDGYRLYPVPLDPELRAELETKSQHELVEILKGLTTLHNNTDTTQKKRTIRAIEIAKYCSENNIVREKYPSFSYLTFGISLERRLLKQKITVRLKERLENGMIEEVEGLLKKGITTEQLKFYGLEYRFLTQYLSGELNYNDMFQKLNAAIQQFAKRQMTWFKRMEKQGHQIHWMDGNMDMSAKLDIIRNYLKSDEKGNLNQTHHIP